MERVLIIYFNLACSGNGIPMKLTNILHVNAIVKGSKRSLLFAVMSKKNMFAAQSILLKLEGYMHNDNLDAIFKCILDQMGSGKLSNETIKSVKKLYPKKKVSKKKIMKYFLEIFGLLMPLKLFPITMDVVTDSLLLKKYYDKSGKKTVSMILHNSPNSGQYYFTLKVVTSIIKVI